MVGEAGGGGRGCVDFPNGPAPLPSWQPHPQGSARQPSLETGAPVPFSKMETDILRSVSFLDDPVAFWSKVGGKKPGRPL